MPEPWRVEPEDPNEDERRVRWLVVRRYKPDADELDTVLATKEGAQARADELNGD